MAYNPNVYCGRCGVKLQPGEERYSLQHRPTSGSSLNQTYVKTFCADCGTWLVQTSDAQPGEAAERIQMTEAARRLGGNG